MNRTVRPKLEIIRVPLGLGIRKEGGFEVFRGGEDDGDGLLAWF